MTRNERGQATVEMAFALIFFVVILFAIIDFGRIFHAYLTLEHAGREGARIASLGGTDIQVVESINTSAPSLTNIGITISPQGDQRVRGEYVTIQLSYPITFTTPLLSPLFREPLSLQSKTVMRVE